MLLNAKKILGLPVYTEVGVKIGRVFDITLDADAHAVREYCVRAGLVGREKIIKPVQIKSITAEKMTVEDAVIKNAAAAAEQSSGGGAVFPVMTREEE